MRYLAEVNYRRGLGRRLSTTACLLFGVACGQSNQTSNSAMTLENDAGSREAGLGESVSLGAIGRTESPLTGHVGEGTKERSSSLNENSLGLSDASVASDSHTTADLSTAAAPSATLDTSTTSTAPEATDAGATTTRSWGSTGLSTAASDSRSSWTAGSEPRAGSGDSSTVEVEARLVDGGRGESAGNSNAQSSSDTSELSRSASGDLLSGTREVPLDSSDAGSASTEDVAPSTSTERETSACSGECVAPTVADECEVCIQAAQDQDFVQYNETVCNADPLCVNLKRCLLNDTSDPETVERSCFNYIPATCYCGITTDFAPCEIDPSFVATGPCAAETIAAVGDAQTPQEVFQRVTSTEYPSGRAYQIVDYARQVCGEACGFTRLF